MRSFRWPLLALVVLTLIALAGYLTGLFPGEIGGGNGISVSRETGEGTETLLISLRHTHERTRWTQERKGYRIDIRRQGPNLYSLNIALVDHDKETETRRQINTSLYLQPGRNLIGGFTAADQEPGGSPNIIRQRIVVRVLP